MDYQSAEQVRTPAGRQYHVGAAPGEIAPSILLVGDPDRARKVADRFDSVRFEGSHREYRIFTGEHRGLPLSVVCVGMGAGSMEIALVELAQLVTQPTFIRCGSSGGLQPNLALGELVVTLGAVRLESASAGYVEPGYPAYAHPEAVMALTQAAAEQGAPFRLGVTATAAGFYGSQGRSVPGFPPRDEALIDRLTRQNVLNLEMETSCLLTLAALRGLRAGAVCAIYANRPQNVFIDDDARAVADDRCIEVSLTALHRLAQMSEEAAGGPWHPGLSRHLATAPAAEG